MTPRLLRCALLYCSEGGAGRQVADKKEDNGVRQQRERGLADQLGCFVSCEEEVRKEASEDPSFGYVEEED